MTHCGPINHLYELFGLIDAQGRFLPSTFYKAYTQGEHFVFEGYDASPLPVVRAFNAAVKDGFADFADGRHEMHPEFRYVRG